MDIDIYRERGVYIGLVEYEEKSCYIIYSSRYTYKYISTHIYIE